MKQIILCIGLLAGLFGYGHAQTPAQMQKSEQVMAKMRQIDLLTQMVPLVLTKEQINKLLPAIERARAKVREIQKAEALELEKIDGKLTDAIAKSINTGVPPPQDLLLELSEMTLTMSLKRQVAMQENTDAVLKVFNEVCNEGQKKAAANSLAPQLLDPSLKPDQMTQADKIKFFIREILLDPQSYEVLQKLGAKAS